MLLVCFIFFSLFSRQMCAVRDWLLIRQRYYFLCRFESTLFSSIRWLISVLVSSIHEIQLLKLLLIFIEWRFFSNSRTKPKVNRNVCICTSNFSMPIFQRIFHRLNGCWGSSMLKILEYSSKKKHENYAVLMSMSKFENPFG